MKTGIVAMICALALIGPATANDIVVEYDRPPPTFGKPSAETLYQHGDRMLIESNITNERTGERFVRREFTRPGQAVAFRMLSQEDGTYVSLTLMDDPLDAPPPKSLRNYPGDTGKVLGETCRIWQAVRPTDSKWSSDFVQSGCSTKDGVELWRRQASIDAIFARKVQRRPVSAESVRPPIEALDLSRWADLKGHQGHSADYEVELRSESGRVRHRIARRSGAWVSVREGSYGPWFGHSVRNKENGIRTQYSKDPKGNRQFTISRGRPTADDGRVRLKNVPDETILGERCEWWDSMPHTYDAGQTDCITRDGIILKTNYVSMGSVSSIQAIRLTRSPQPLAAVLPSADIVSPSAWGF